MPGLHDLVPLGLAERQHPPGPSRVVRCENSDVGLDLAAPERVGDDTCRDLTRRGSKNIVSGR
jgi:hypothetical protein